MNRPPEKKPQGAQIGPRSGHVTFKFSIAKLAFLSFLRLLNKSLGKGMKNSNSLLRNQFMIHGSFEKNLNIMDTILLKNFFEILNLGIQIEYQGKRILGLFLTK